MKSLVKALVLVLALICCVFIPTGCFQLMNQPNTALAITGLVGLALFGWILFQGGKLWLKW